MPKQISWYELGTKVSKREHADTAWKRYFKRWGRSLTPAQAGKAKTDFYSGFRDAKYRLARTNPASVIPRSWKQAKVRRLKDGRVQVMIPGSSRNPSPLPKTARPSKKGSGWAPVSAGLDKGSASSLASYYRGLGWKSRAVKRGTKYDVLVARPKRK
jgi:hypothetical protein